MKVRKVDMSDHEFAAELRKRKAIDNYRNTWNMTLWSNEGVIVGFMLYDYGSPGRLECEKYLVDYG